MEDDDPDPFQASNAWACGASASGELGTGSSEASLQPARVRARHAFSTLALGNGTGAAVSSDTQALYVWGRNDRGQLGRGTADEAVASSPLLVEALDGKCCVGVAVGFEHVAVVSSDGFVRCWGSNDSGQCGVDGATHVCEPRVVRWRPSLLSQRERVVAVACGEAHTFALSSLGQALGWGRNSVGQLGLGDLQDRSTPAALERLWGVPLVGIAAGDSHSLAVSLCGAVFAWGRASSGALGLTAKPLPRASRRQASSRPAPAAVVAALVEMGIEQELAEEAAIAAPGVEAAVEWALTAASKRTRIDDFPPTALAPLTSGCVTLPRRITAVHGGGRLPRAVAVAAGGSHSCLLTAGGEVYTCGAGASGQLGHGRMTGEPLPRRLPLPQGVFIASMAAGAAHTLLLADDGTPYAFGAGEDGALGGSSSTDSPVPVKLSGVTALAAGGFSSAFLVGSAARRQSWVSPLSFLHTALDADGRAGGAERVAEAAALTLGSVCGAVSSFAVPLPADGGSEDEEDEASAPVAHPRPLIEALALEAVSTRTLQLGLRAPALVSALRTAADSLIAELAAHASGLTRREHAAALAVALSSPLMGGSSTGLPLLRALCPVVAAASSAVHAALRNGWASTPAALLASRTTRPLQAFVTAEIRAANATTPSSVAAIKILALVAEANAAPGRSEARLAEEELYNDFISQHFNVKGELSLWKSGAASFSFCAFPFLLNPGAKAKLLRCEAVERMCAAVATGRAAAAVAATRAPASSPRWLRFLAGEFGAPFGLGDSPPHAPPPPSPRSLNGDLPPPCSCGVPGMHPEACVVRVRRGQHFMRDLEQELARQASEDLVKPLKVVFIGEAGIDAGGLTKELFLLSWEQLADPLRGLFTVVADGRARWLAQDGPAGGAEDAARQTAWGLVGMLLGLALHNGVLLELRLPRAFYRKLLGAPLGLSDLEDFDAAVGKSMRSLLAWQGPGSVADVFSLTFTIDIGGSTVPLAAGGAEMLVTEENRERFVAAYVEHALSGCCARGFGALRASFLGLCGGHALRLVSPSELEVLICGTPHLDFAALERAARYSGGWSADHPTVRAFWSCVHTQMNLDERKALLRFITSSDRAPIGGLGALSILVTRDGPDSGRLPTAHTCFSQICLPEYSSRAKVSDRLKCAVYNAAEGFGLT